uniref:Carboxypeptidase n=1 Tax=Heterosigma akashiwo TaxID=2829 RepID=A0A6S9GAZ6_HETAK|mmetsp:Transcript_15819/g.21791  ORF Transcript_15819/g.21791 Transcript_15819/m.21791 type:complete len:464 (-) Transcript_15819:641-2032(-)
MVGVHRSSRLALVAFIGCLMISYAERIWKSHLHGSQETGSLQVKSTNGLCDPDVDQLSGYFKIDGSVNKNYFFWFFESRDSPSTDPLIIWLTGGPGCSSILALLAENGPCTVNEDGASTTVNPFSWNSHANIMWVDQPAGVGFSYGAASDYDRNEAEVGEDMYHFVKEFLAQYPQYAAQDFYVFGESYGGHYVPAVSSRIYRGNQEGDGAPVNLKGIGIGNGLTNPLVQFEYYADMAVNNTYGVKAISDHDYLAMKAATPKCLKMIEACQSYTAACALARAYCDAVTLMPYQRSGLNVYDIRRPCGDSSLCYDFAPISKFLQLESTLAALGVSEESARWEECNNKVNGMFASDWMKSFHGNLVPMLEGGVRVLVYAGDCDYICNWMGNKAWTLALGWAGQAAFNRAEDRDWVLDGERKGVVRSAGGLTFLQVFEAGHMVPMDQPAAALALLQAFVAGGRGFEK